MNNRVRNPRRVWKCFSCEETFTIKSELYQHRDRFHNFRENRVTNAVENDEELARRLQAEENTILINDYNQRRRRENIIIIEEDSDLNYDVERRAAREPIRRMKKDLPSHVAKMVVDKADNCPICIGPITVDNVCMSFCGHIYCKECLENVKAQEEPKCAICRESFYE